MVGVRGVGSGIDIDSIITAMVNAERAPKTSQLDKLEQKSTTQFSALGSLRSSLANFQSALAKLNKLSIFERRSATATPSGQLSATASSTAPAGNFDVRVQQLAAGSKVALKSYAEAPTFGSGSLTISAGDPADEKTPKFTLNVDSSNNTLAGLRDAINTQGAASGFSASIITDASGSRLVLSSSRMGDGADIRVSVTPADEEPGEDETDLAELAFMPQLVDADDASKGFVAPNSTAGGGAAGVITRATSARLTVDGLQVTRNTNAIADAIEGVTLNLTKADPDTSVNVVVSQDRAGVRSNLNEFITAYNALFTTMGSLTAVVNMGEGKAPSTGALVGDAAVRGLQSGIRSALTQMQSDSGIAALAQLGVTTDKSGKLSLDQAALDKALASDFDGVAQYLAGENGLMARLDKVVAGYTKNDGVLDQRQASLRKTLTSVDQQRLALDRRVTQMKDRLLAQYTAMDTLLANMNSTSTWLNAQLSNLPGVVRKKD